MVQQLVKKISCAFFFILDFVLWHAVTLLWWSEEKAKTGDIKSYLWIYDDDDQFLFNTRKTLLMEHDTQPDNAPKWEFIPVKNWSNRIQKRKKHFFDSTENKPSCSAKQLHNKG